MTVRKMSPYGNNFVGTHAERPAASAKNANVLYFESDTNALYRSTGTAWAPLADSLQLSFTSDNGASVLATGVKGDIRIPVAGTLTNVTLLLDVSGSIVVDLWKDTFANYPPLVAKTITAAALPTISGGVSYSDSTLTGWTTAVNAGDIVRVNINSVATAKRMMLFLTLKAT